MAYSSPAAKDIMRKIMAFSISFSIKTGTNKKQAGNKATTAFK
jgi:hypothetical protein